MNQFKPIFLGTQKPPYTRAVNTQKCIRAGGKHNDLDDVGRSRRHHTFFEMLGNWSFGDYFKRGAIEMAWELLTQVWKLDPTRLHVTCFEGNEKNGVPRDTEAADLWKQVAGLPDSQIHYFGKDNFWEMGETGPCGPCTEIHIDQTPDKLGGDLVNGSDPRVMEIWNLVFIQYNRNADRSLAALPAQHVDTGMGFERICQVLQGKSDNYAIDLWTPFFAHISKLTGATYNGTFPASDTDRTGEEQTNSQLRKDIAFRVIADHGRMATFAINDGAKPDNKGRDSVVRSVIRRAVRFGYQEFALREPFVHTLVPVVVRTMGEAFPELERDPVRIESIIRDEETSFLRTIERGLTLFEEAAARGAKTHTMAASDVLKLHETYGFPSDMTMQLAAERGLKVDRGEYDRLWEEFTRKSGEGRKAVAQTAVDLSSFPKTDDSPKYEGLTSRGKLLGWVSGNELRKSGRLSKGDEAGLILDRTPFYAEQGGQVSDVGQIATSTGRFDVTFCAKQGDYVVHYGRADQGNLEVGQTADAAADPRRQDTMRNHTATHLMNWALRRVLGDHVEQKGSEVSGERLRFDFSHGFALGGSHLETVERLVNEKILANLPVSATVMPLSEAKMLAGVRAVFGEKYPDPVRVIAIGTEDPRRESSVEMSIEFCGGTHLRATGQAGFFKIVREESLSKGVRRITAITGRAAEEHVRKLEEQVRQVTQALGGVSIEEAPNRIAALQEEIKALKQKAKGGADQVDPSAAAGKLLSDAQPLGPGKLIVGEIPGATDDQLRAAMDSLKKKSGSYGIMLASADDGKVNFVAAVSDDLIAKGLKAGDWIRETAKVAGGGGGGRPQMAQAGGKDPAKIGDALQTAREFAAKSIA